MSSGPVVDEISISDEAIEVVQAEQTARETRALLAAGGLSSLGLPEDFEAA